MSNKKEASEIDWDLEKVMFEEDMKVFVEVFAICDELTKQNPNVDIDGEAAFRMAEEVVRESRREERSLVVSR